MKTYFYRGLRSEKHFQSCFFSMEKSLNRFRSGVKWLYTLRMKLCSMIRNYKLKSRFFFYKKERLLWYNCKIRLSCFGEIRQSTIFIDFCTLHTPNECTLCMQSFIKIGQEVPELVGDRSLRFGTLAELIFRYVSVLLWQNCHFGKLYRTESKHYKNRKNHIFSWK